MAPDPLLLVIFLKNFVPVVNELLSLNETYVKKQQFIMPITKVCLGSFVPKFNTSSPRMTYNINRIPQCTTFNSSHLVIDSICSGTLT